MKYCCDIDTLPDLKSLTRQLNILQKNTHISKNKWIVTPLTLSDAICKTDWTNAEDEKKTPMNKLSRTFTYFLKQRKSVRKTR